MELEPDLEISEDWFTEVGKAEDVTFYAMMIPEVTEAYLEGIAPAYQEEFKTLREELLEILKNGEYFEPVIQGADLIGKTLRFETTDVDGNPVKSEDIFKENDITMINIWATWCGNCVRTQSANNAGVYRVIVADEEGKLIEGAVVQFCSDSTCTMGKTDENGAAEFKAKEGIYTIHILKVPAGYQKTSEEIQTDALYSDVYFVLKKA